MAEMDDDELLAALEVEIAPLKTSNRIVVQLVI